jgi:hypothetical protein
LVVAWCMKGIYTLGWANTSITPSISRIGGLVVKLAVAILHRTVSASPGFDSRPMHFCCCTGRRECRDCGGVEWGIWSFAKNAQTSRIGGAQSTPTAVRFPADAPPTVAILIAIAMV